MILIMTLTMYQWLGIPHQNTSEPEPNANSSDKDDEGEVDSRPSSPIPNINPPPLAEPPLNVFEEAPPAEVVPANLHQQAQPQIPEERIVPVGTIIKYKRNNSWSIATVVHMAKKSIQDYPHWYNIRTLIRGKSHNRSIELFVEERGTLWDIVQPAWTVQRRSQTI